MRSKITNVKEVLENAEKIIDIPLNYKSLTERLHIGYLSGSCVKRAQLANLACYVRYEVTKKPTRYIIKEIYDEPKIKYNGNCRPELRAELLKLCERRYVDIVGELPEIITLNDSFNYVCKFHPNAVQHSKVVSFMKGIGCPLCHYPMSRTEVMIYLGIEGAKHRVKIDSTEFDIYIPSIQTVVEFDGLLYHKDDEENGRAEKKAGVAKQNNLKLVKIIEGERYSEMRIEGDYIYIPPYESVTKAEKAQMISLIQEVLPYKHSDELWDKAADYMRDWKYNLHILNSQSDSSSIKQYDESGKLIAEYKNFNEIKNAIAKGNAFGFNWIIGE